MHRAPQGYNECCAARFGGKNGLEVGVFRLEATVGFEPTHRGFADPRLNHLATSPVK